MHLIPNPPPYKCSASHGLGGLLISLSLLSPAGALRNKLGQANPCVELLVEGARTCRSEHQPFSITDFITISDATLGVIPSSRHDDEAASAVNTTFPGLQLLDSQHQVYSVDSFFSPADVSALLQEANFSAFLPSVMRAAEATPALEANRGPGDRSCRGLLSAAGACSRVGQRNSSTLVLDDRGRSAKLVRQRIAQLLPGLTHHHCLEPLGLTRYEAGGFYSRHADGRRATVIVYLGREDAVGGGTFFPHISLRVVPQVGRALLFFPTFADGERKSSMVHMAEELQEGEKFVLQQWIDLPGQRDCKKGTSW